MTWNLPSGASVDATRGVAERAFLDAANNRLWTTFSKSQREAQEEETAYISLVRMLKVGGVPASLLSSTPWSADVIEHASSAEYCAHHAAMKACLFFVQRSLQNESTRLYRVDDYG
jgi:hypothetical protein